jgi:pilus assembly protein FimV
MLRQEMQAKEDLAAREAEVTELKARVAELEKLQQQQQQLITMKDSELAAVQQRLAARESAATAPPPAGDGAEAASATPWLFGGAGLLALGVLAWLFSRRRRDASAPRRTYDTAALAAGIPGARTSDDLFSERDDDGDADVREPVSPPQWSAAAATPAGIVPTWHGGAPAGLGEALASERTDAGRKLDQARAYMDLGDDESARRVLRELLDSRDPTARDAAASLLRDL